MAKKFSELTAQTTADTSQLFAVAYPDGQSPTGFTSKKMTLDTVEKHAVGTATYNDLNTTSKTVVGAVNEVRGTILTGTLSAGSTSVTLSNAAITTSSTIDIYTDVFGVNPTAVTVTTGQIVLTFAARQSALNVKVRVS